uniref:Uncharacterized protein n=1 Tax=Maylandia zebra TaxID=106582 RepID=A0A3P9BW50_9CICH
LPSPLCWHSRVSTKNSCKDGSREMIAVPGQESSRVVALPASVSDGSGKSQAIVNEDLGIPWSSWISTRNHCK